MKMYDFSWNWYLTFINDDRVMIFIMGTIGSHFTWHTSDSLLFDAWDNKKLQR